MHSSHSHSTLIYARESVFDFRGCPDLLNCLWGRIHFQEKMARHVLRIFTPFTSLNLLNCTKINYCPQHYEINSKSDTPGKIPPQIYTDHCEFRASLYMHFPFQQPHTNQEPVNRHEVFRVQKNQKIFAQL